MHFSNCTEICLNCHNWFFVLNTFPQCNILYGTKHQASLVTEPSLLPHVSVHRSTSPPRASSRLHTEDRAVDTQLAILAALHTRPIPTSAAILPPCCFWVGTGGRKAVGTTNLCDVPFHSSTWRLASSMARQTNFIMEHKSDAPWINNVQDRQYG